MDIENPVIDFLKDILVGTISGLKVKEKAFDLYTDIIKADIKKDYASFEGYLSYSIPDSVNVLYIKPAVLQRVKDIMRSGQKIAAIKELRANSVINLNSDPSMEHDTGGPSLKDAKYFVESLI
jgi:hypothetical protein